MGWFVQHTHQRSMVRGLPLQCIYVIVRGKRGTTPETAWLFSEALGTIPEFWINLQNAHDLTRSRPARKVEQIKASAHS